jgi:hypothetical protein
VLVDWDAARASGAEGTFITPIAKATTTATPVKQIIERALRNSDNATSWMVGCRRRQG